MTSKTSPGRATVLGINGHVGHEIAEAFAAAGWTVAGFGRSNRRPIAGVRFIKGDAGSVPDMAAAIADADVVVNALNLPYDKWDKGRMEGLTTRVIAAVGPKSGKTLMFPANIYNYAASQREVTPDAPQHPQTPRGEIRVRCEELLKAAAARGDLQLVMVRAGDFFGPGSQGDWFDQIIMREAAKRRFAVPGAPGIGHSWAYLPDLAAAFEKLAWHRAELGASELFHFAGHFMTPEQLAAAIRDAAPVPLTQAPYPWTMLKLMALAMPVIREVVKMRYLWENQMQLKDARLDALLGPEFGTPMAAAVGATIAPFLAAERLAA